MSKKEKIIIVVLCMWSFIHIYLLINNWSGIKNNYVSNIYDDKHLNKYRDSVPYAPNERFYPFTVVKHKIQKYDDRFTPARLIADEWDFKSYYFNEKFYDFTEFFVYVAGVWMIFFLFRFLKKE